MSVINPTYSDAILALVPNAVFVTVNDEITVWESTEQQPTKQAIEAKLAELNAQVPLEKCKEKAKELLASSDWSVLSDVGLQNSADFVTYRGILRGLVISPVENPDFPTEPNPIWE